MDSVVLNTAEEDVIEWECGEGLGHDSLYTI